MAQGGICSSEHFTLNLPLRDFLPLRERIEVRVQLRLLFFPAFVLAHQRDHHALNF